MRVYLVSWVEMNKDGLRSDREWMNVEARDGWEAKDIAEEYLKEAGYGPRVEVRVHAYIVKGDTGVENLG